MKIVDLKREAVIEAVEIVPKEYKIFKKEQIAYVDALTGQILLNDTKGQILNVIEGIGLPERQETAVKRMITNILHDVHNEISNSLELVKAQ
jgi:hypothetical protein